MIASHGSTRLNQAQHAEQQEAAARHLRHCQCEALQHAALELVGSDLHLVGSEAWPSHGGFSPKSMGKIHHTRWRFELELHRTINGGISLAMLDGRP